MASRVDGMRAEVTAAGDAASGAQKAADGKSTILYLTVPPAASTGGRPGDTAFVTVDGVTAGIYRCVAGTGGASGNVWARIDIGGGSIADGAVTSVKIADLDAGKITTGTLDAARIAAGSITTPMLAAGAVTADVLGANSVVAGKVAAGSVSATELAVDSVTSAKIQAGAVTADKIQARAVTADKMIIGSTSNMLPDPTFLTRDAGMWTTAAARDLSTVRTPGVASLRHAAGTTVRSAYYGNFNVSNNWAPVGKANTSYQVMAYVRSDQQIPASGALLYLFLSRADGAGGYTTIGPISNQSAIPANQWTLVQGTLTAGATQGESPYLNMGLYANNTTTGQVWFTEPVLRQMNSGELIVDGSITTVKLAAKSITAAQLAAGAVTANEIAAGAVTAGKISGTAIDGMTITGATIQTVATASRGIKITTAELAAYNTSGVKTVSINASTGEANLTGTIKTSSGVINAELSGNAIGYGPGIKFACNTPDAAQPSICATGSATAQYILGDMILRGTEQVQNSSGVSQLVLGSRGTALFLGKTGGPWDGAGLYVNSAALYLRGSIPDGTYQQSQLAMSAGNTGNLSATAGSLNVVTAPPKYGSGWRPFVTAGSATAHPYSVSGVTSTGFTINWTGSAAIHWFNYMLIQQ